MIMKCRDMERVMAPTNHKLLHGGIRSKDWFSDKLQKDAPMYVTIGNNNNKTSKLSCFMMFGFGVGQFWPVQSVAHLNGDQHRQSHCHGWSSLKHLALNTSKVLVISSALHEVGLVTENRYSIIILLWNVSRCYCILQLAIASFSRFRDVRRQQCCNTQVQDHILGAFGILSDLKELISTSHIKYGLGLCIEYCNTVCSIKVKIMVDSPAGRKRP